jgi:hypothetical protein
MTYFVWDLGDNWYGALGLAGSLITMIVVSLFTHQDPKDSKDFYDALQKGEELSYEIENSADFQ